MQHLHGTRVSVLAVFQLSLTVYTLQNCRMKAYPLYSFIFFLSPSLVSLLIQDLATVVTRLFLSE